jgi:hypothetical protein
MQRSFKMDLINKTEIILCMMQWLTLLRYISISVGIFMQEIMLFEGECKSDYFIYIIDKYYSCLTNYCK